MAPRVTVAVPMYNAAATVAETLESLLAQTYPELEIVLVDNCSTDATREVVERVAGGDPRVRVRRNERNLGGEGNFNRCLQQGEGEYLAIFHADDLYLPTMVEKQVAFLDAHPEVGAVFPRSIAFGPEGERRRSLWPSSFGAAESVCLDFERFFELTLCHGNALATTPGFMGRRRVVARTPGFDFERHRSSADLGLWLAIARQSAIGFLSEPLMRYRLSVSQGTVKINHKRTEPADFFRVIEPYLEELGGLERFSPQARAGYRALRQEDAVLRALTMLVQGQQAPARELLAGVPSGEAARCLMARAGGAKLIVTAILLRAAVAAGLGRPFAAWVYRTRYGLWPDQPMRDRNGA